MTKLAFLFAVLCACTAEIPVQRAPFEATLKPDEITCGTSKPMTEVSLADCRPVDTFSYLCYGDSAVTLYELDYQEVTHSTWNGRKWCIDYYTIVKVW